jgi:dTDP-glucose pyrophosphorylase
MRTDLAAVSVAAHATVREAMLAIDRGRAGIALVVGPEGRLLGTVTDGDLRRAILRGVTLEQPVAPLMNAAFVSVGPDATRPAVLSLMRARSVRQVPVLDDRGVLVGLHSMPELVEPSPRPNWAVVMAGGEGKRLRPLTADVPKPMLRVGDRPLLERVVALLVDHGFRTIYLAVNYLGHQIEAHFGDGQRFGCRIGYLRETKPLGTAGALGLLPGRPTAPLLVMNGDLLTDVNLGSLMEYHEECGCSGTQCVLEHVIDIPFGVVRCQDGQVVALEEKPRQYQLINAGIYVLSPELLDLVPHDQPFTMPSLIELARARDLTVAAFPIRERWADIGRPGDYEQARDEWTGDRA